MAGKEGRFVPDSINRGTLPISTVAVADMWGNLERRTCTYSLMYLELQNVKMRENLYLCQKQNKTNPS